MTCREEPRIIYDDDDDDEMQELVGDKNDTGGVQRGDPAYTKNRRGLVIVAACSIFLFAALARMAFVYSRSGFRDGLVVTKGENATTADTTTTTIPAISSAAQAVKLQQIANFRNHNNQSLFLNFHITHHGGTTVCREVGYKLTRPSFACLKPKEGDGSNISSHDFPTKRPWFHSETEENIALARKNFQMISWEFSGGSQNPKCSDTNWEHPNLVSLLVMREPISRALAGDGRMNKKYTGIWKSRKNKNGPDATEEEWWRFARDEPKHNNNFALRVLTDSTCCNGSHTDLHYLEEAKALVSRFTFVLDIACLQHGLEKVAEVLGFALKEAGASQDHHHSTAKEKIPFPEVYDYLVEKNKLDIELYEWSKTISLVNCDAILGRK